MRKVGNYFTGRVKTESPANVSADRYDYLRLEEAEPNLGVANTDDSILFYYFQNLFLNKNNMLIALILLHNLFPVPNKQ